jgi:hypothetical protein
VAVVGIALAMVAAPRASGQEECSCTEKDPATSVELRITAATPEDHSRIGSDQETLVSDLRGTETVLVGEAPQLLSGVDLAEVPVLMAVGEGASDADECTEPLPAEGSDLSLTGHVYMEETGPVVWTGTCQGTLTVEAAAPASATDEDPWGRDLELSAAVLAAAAFVCLALALTTRAEESEG